jgi:hypothetical protein
VLGVKFKSCQFTSPHPLATKKKKATALAPNYLLYLLLETSEQRHLIMTSTNASSFA